MRSRNLALGMMSAAAAAAALLPSDTPEKEIVAGPLRLTVGRAVYAYDPALRGVKGDGNLGQAEDPIQVGDTVVAACVYRPPDYVEEGYDKADAIKIQSGKFAGKIVPLEVYVDINGQGVYAAATSVFTTEPDQIRSRAGFCPPVENLG